MKAHDDGFASPSSTGKSLCGGSSVTVALVENNAEFADALAACLSHRPDLEVLGILSTVRDALDHIPVWKPDIVLLDLGLPDGSGIEVLRVLSASMTDTIFVVLTVFEDDESIREALSAGALGYMLKRSGSRAILEGVSLAAGGGSPLDAQITRRLLEVLRSQGSSESQAIRDLNELTAKENLLLRQMAKTGDSVKEIADALGLTYATVRTYIRRIYIKLGVHNRSQAERKLLRLHQNPS